jgi:hypothetical protein
MQVFAEYIEENGIVYRKNTLLQFGSSWKLIGNVVLANPGSARPASKLNSEDMQSVGEFFSSYRYGTAGDPINWYEFSPDSTMRQVEKIFSGWYLGKDKELKGVIQLFNTFNIINQNLSEAIKLAENVSEHMFSVDCYKYFNNRPTYLGYSSAVLRDKILSRVAKDIFENSPEEVKRPYQKQFLSNKFYHPGYVNRSYRRDHFRSYKEEVLSAMEN